MLVPPNIATWSPGTPADPQRPLLIPEAASRRWPEWAEQFPEISQFIKGSRNPMWDVFMNPPADNDQAVVYPLEIVNEKTYAAIRAKHHHLEHTRVGAYLFVHHILPVASRREVVVCCGTKAFAPTHLRVYAM